MILSRAELAEAFGVSTNTVTAWRWNGLPCVSDGGPGIRAQYNFEAVAVYLRMYSGFDFAGWRDSDDVIREARRRAKAIIKRREKAGKRRALRRNVLDSQ